MKEQACRQTCKVCLREDCFDFHVPDEVWQRIVPHEFQNSAVCLGCFDRFAAERKVDYTPYLALLYFAGDQACFEFKVVWGSSTKT
ncbi:MAG: hypothetical protein HY313_03400 [Acidobacteria bacterium]|nr:hypothetical protein [Acidobacteriota bacterium]